MNTKLIRLAERRERLVARAAAQRMALAQDLAPWRAPLALADRGIAALRYVRRHPALWVGAAFALVSLRPRRAGMRLDRLWAAWRLGRRLFMR